MMAASVGGAVTSCGNSNTWIGRRKVEYMYSLTMTDARYMGVSPM